MTLRKPIFPLYQVPIHITCIFGRILYTFSKRSQIIILSFYLIDFICFRGFLSWRVQVNHWTWISLQSLVIDIWSKPKICWWISICYGYLSLNSLHFWALIGFLLFFINLSWWARLRNLNILYSFNLRFLGYLLLF